MRVLKKLVWRKKGPIHTWKYIQFYFFTNSFSKQTIVNKYMSRISNILFLFFKWFLSSPNKGWCCYICLAKKWCRIYMGRHRIKSVVETQTRWETFLQNNLTTKYAHQFPRLQQTWILRNVCMHFFCFSLKRKRTLVGDNTKIMKDIIHFRIVLLLLNSSFYFCSPIMQYSKSFIPTFQIGK